MSTQNEQNQRDDAQSLQAEIEATRDDLAGTVDALAAKLDVKSRVKGGIQGGTRRATGAVTAARDRVKARATQTRDRVKAGATQTRDRVKAGATQTRDQVKTRATRTYAGAKDRAGRVGRAAASTRDRARRRLLQTPLARRLPARWRSALAPRPAVSPGVEPSRQLRPSPSPRARHRRTPAIVGASVAGLGAIVAALRALRRRRSSIRPG